MCPPPTDVLKYLNDVRRETSFSVRRCIEYEGAVAGIVCDEPIVDDDFGGLECSLGIGLLEEPSVGEGYAGERREFIGRWENLS